ncbi:hypothetical protein MsAg5_07800 [Methanosarcinaceae archaeon Ag5]|uniref:Schlafen AlbA-2 domain-containing protein n=1 Tax=Methanolapillus africanus TaxID=3028297 RepID=A0AAE4MJA3_9EURY|nr:hypothetical protein [Methanosarcinaceae archaeon Ag5]
MIQDLELIISEGEGYTVEFKEKPDKKLAEEICAFANASGGRIYIGVSDSGNMTGTDVSNSARSKIQDFIRQIEPPLPVKTEIDSENCLIILTVPFGGRKPYCCSSGFFMRYGPNSQKLRRDEIIGLLKSEGVVSYDSWITDFLVRNDFNEKFYQTYLEKSGISPCFSKEAVLFNLNCAEKNDDGELVYTNAGALFFRNNAHDFIFRHASIVCTLFKGTDRANVLAAVEFSENLIENIEQSLRYLKQNLKTRYVFEGLTRKNILEIPEIALREAVINAVCHRDYFNKGSRIMIEIFDDRLEITNPGGIINGVTNENFGTVSMSRNPVLADLLFRAGYVEKMGTGVSRIQKSVKEAGLSDPIFETSGFFKVIFPRQDDSLFSFDAVRESGEVYVGKPLLIFKDEPVIVLKPVLPDSQSEQADDRDENSKSDDVINV